MRFALSEDQRALRDGVRELLAGECPPALVRAAWTDPAAAARSLWAKLTALGIAGAAVPTARGGLGLAACDVVPLLEEAGRAAVPLPILETAFVAAPLLAQDAGATPALERLLAGELLVACALDGATGVPYGAIADLVLVSAGAADGLAVHVLDAGSACRPERSIDHARAVARLLTPPSVDRRPLALTHGERVAAWHRGVVGCAAELVGLGRTLLARTAAYVKERHQFGVPVGSFQAVKHHLADGLLALEFAAPAVLRAAWSIDRGCASVGRDAAMAKALASEAAERVARIALQCHGAIAYTTEYDLHLFAKRVWASSRTWGSAEWQRGRVAVALGLQLD